VLPLGPLDAGGDQLVLARRKFGAGEALTPPTRVADLPVEHRVDQFATGGAFETVGVREDPHLGRLRHGGRRGGAGGDAPCPGRVSDVFEGIAGRDGVEVDEGVGQAVAEDGAVRAGVVVADDGARPGERAATVASCRDRSRSPAAATCASAQCRNLAGTRPGR